MVQIFTSLRNTTNRTSQTVKSAKFALLSKTTTFARMKLSTKLLWEEGLYIDFIQKKSTDKFVRKVIIHTLNIFSERLVFDKLVLTIPTLLVRWAHFFSVFELRSVSSLITITLITTSLLLLLNFLNLVSVIVVTTLL